MNGSVVIRILGLVEGGQTAYDGQYVVAFNAGLDGFEPMSGRPMMCHLVTTPSVWRATRYSTDAAIELWRSIDPRRPLRPDGKPNRPLSAFTVEIGEPINMKDLP